MPIVVIAKAPAEYEAWINSEEERRAKAKAEELELLAMNMGMDELMSVGERTYIAHCAACHQPNGEGLPGIFPALKGSALALHDKTGHISIVLNGKTGTSMQAYAKQLSLKELAAVITYERNAWGNNTGELVQAADVHAVLQGKGE